MCFPIYTHTPIVTSLDAFKTWLSFDKYFTEARNDRFELSETKTAGEAAFFWVGFLKDIKTARVPLQVSRIELLRSDFKNLGVAHGPMDR